jgi:hypothetical protein
MMLKAIIGLAITFLTWCVYNFVGKPYLQFRDLRRKTTATIADLGNVRAQWKESQDGHTQQIDLPPSDQKRLSEAKTSLRKLGTEMKAFAENEWMVVWLLERGGYDPNKAWQGLMGLSNSISTYGKERHHFGQMIQKALRLPQ